MYGKMRNIELKIGRIPVTAKLLLYTLLTISVISIVIGSTLTAVTYDISSLELFIYVPVAILSGIGFVAIILEIAKRWQRVGGALFVGIAIFVFASLPSGFNEELDLFHDHPYLVAPLLVWNICWLISGIIIILRGKSFLTVKGS